MRDSHSSVASAGLAKAATTPPRPAVLKLLSQIWNLAGARLAGAALGLLSQILLTRTFAKPEVGMALLAMSAAAVISLLMTAGYPILSIGYLARYYTLGRAKLVEAFYAAARRDALTAAALLLPLIAIGVYVLPLHAEAKTAMYFGCLGAIPYAAMRLNNSAANALKRFTLSFVPDFVYRPLLLLLFIVAMLVLWPGFPITAVLWAIVVITAAVAAVQAMLLGRNNAFKGLFHRQRRALAEFYRGRAAALLMSAVVTITFADIVTLISGFFVGPAEVAVLGIAIKLAALVGFVTQSSQVFIMRDLTAAMTRGTRRDVQSLLLRTNLSSLLVMAVALAGGAAFGDTALSLFGEGYATGYWALILFLMSQTLRAGSSMNVHVLSLSGHQSRTALSCILFVASLVAGMAVLAPAHGINGAALAVVVADTIWAIALAVYARIHASHGADIVAVISGRA
jgi:O-antigen/teichoic acid export membrane protein